MGLRRLFHILSCIGIAAIVATGVYLLDTQRSGVHQSVAGLRWARQVASQAEGMTLKAREAKERDPLGWAVNYLTQGVEPRLVRITKIKLGDSGSSPGENYSLDAETGLFEFNKLITPEDGTGIHISLSLGYIGFLGAKSGLANDLLAFSFFVVCFALLFIPLGEFFGFKDGDSLVQFFTEWARGARTQLTQMSGSIRDMVRQAQRLALSSGKSRELVGALRLKIHAGLKDIHESRLIFREFESAATRAENLTTDAITEAKRSGGDARKISEMAAEIHSCIQKMRKVNMKSRDLFVKIQRQLEPWAVDVDIAAQSFGDVKKATDTLNLHINQTTEAVLLQAKFIKALNEELGLDDTSEPKITLSASATLPEPLPPIEDQPELSRRKIIQNAWKNRRKKAA